MKITNIFKTCFFGSIAAMSLQGCSYTFAPLVTFDTDGGTPLLCQRVMPNECVARPEIIPVKANVTFIDWFEDKEKTTVYDFSKPVTKDITIYAKYNGIEKLTVVAPNPPTGQSDFKVGDTVNVKDFTVYAIPTVGNPIQIKDFTSPSFDEEGNYKFTYDDVQKAGQIAYHEFVFNYREFKGVSKIHATESGKTNFTIQYSNLLADDYNEHTTEFKDGDKYKFESSDSSKLNVKITSSDSNGNVTVTYNIVKGASLEKNEKLYIKVISKEDNKIYDYFLVQITGKSEAVGIAFGDIDDNNCYAYCEVTEGKRSEWDPSGIGLLLIPTYNKDGKTVTQIGANSESSTRGFQRCTKFTSIELPETLTTIGRYSFTNCSSLKSIYLPKTLKTISYEAFENCEALTSVVFPDDILLETIEHKAFLQCYSLKEFTVPLNVIKLGDKCFYNCKNLEKLIVNTNSTLTSIGKGAFENVSSKLINDEGNARYLIAHDENGIANKHFALTRIKNDSSIISFTTDENCYIVALENAEEYKYLKTLTITDKVTAIASNCFCNCVSIETINFSGTSKLLGIGEWAFGCKGEPVTEMNLKNITIPSSCIYIGADAFHFWTGVTEHFDNAIFEDKTHSWSSSNSQGKTITIETSKISDPSTAASTLKTYMYEWYKNTSL